MQRLTQAYAQSALRSCGMYAVISVAVVALAVVCLFVPLGVYMSVEEDWALGLLVAGAVGFLVTAFGGTAVFAILVLRGRKQRLDAVFEPLGISGRGYLTNGRQYHGAFNGRRVDAYFYRGPAFDLYLGTGVQTRLGATERSLLGGVLSNLANREPLSTPAPELAGLALYADDPVWAARWLSDPEARETLLRLAKPAGDIELRNVLLNPGAVELRLLHTEEAGITADALRAWLEDLQRLARTAESQPAPAPGKPLSTLERRSRENRDAFTLPAVLFALGLILVPALCAAIALIVLLSLPGSS
jgi:hypothetical protein